MTNYNHLCKEQRNTIENLLEKEYNFTYIGNAIGVDRTTIAKEVKRNRYIKNPIYLPHNQRGIDIATKQCDKLLKPPYCCNACKHKGKCCLTHIYYNAKEAQKHYEETLINARTGIDISSEEIEQINRVIPVLIKDKKQSVNQVYANHSDILYFSKTTFYKYVNEGVLQLSNFDLPKKVKYKRRKKNKNTKNKRDLALLKGRRYEDYLKRVSEEKNLHEWQLDTVIGKNDDSKCLMTFLLVETNYMKIFLLDKKNMTCVDEKFDYIKSKMGIKLYKKYINLILTDNGSEFYNPFNMEVDMDTGEVLCSVYYCHPNSPQEKGELEKNHEYIRKVLPKGTSFNNLTDYEVKLLEDNINNIPRDIMGNVTPYNLTKEKYPQLVERLDSVYIEPDNVSLNPKDILGGNNE